MSDAVVEAAGPESVAVAARVFGASLEEAWPPADLEALLATGRGRLFVARTRGGCIEGALLSERLDDEAHVHLLAVDAAARRRGLGAALLATALAEARASGAQRMFLEVRASRRAAVALYAAHGFEQLHRRRPSHPGGDEALLLARTTAPTTTPGPPS